MVFASILAQMSRHRLFFGLQPPAPVLAQLLAAAAQVQAAHAPGGRATPAEKLHLTLAFLGDFEEGDAVRHALTAGGRLDATRFDFVLDRVQSLGGRQPLWVFAGDGAAFAPLHASLVQCLHALGVPAQDEARAFLPHLTWLRNARMRLPPTPIAPIAWPARDFLLYDSRGGHYEVLGRWPLRR